MIEVLQNLPAGVQGISARGKVTAKEYREVVRPLLEKGRARRKLRLLYHVAPGTDFTPGAALEDARAGLRSLWMLERCAIVTDRRWTKKAGRLVAALAPCPVHVYEEANWDQATRWLAEVSDPRRVPHELLPDSGVLVIRPERALSTEDIAAVETTVDAWLDLKGSLHGIVIHATRFPGWETLGSFFRHVRFMRDYQRQVRGVAIVMDGAWPGIARVVAERFVRAEVVHFGYDEYSDAIAWATSVPARVASTSPPADDDH